MGGRLIHGIDLYTGKYSNLLHASFNKSTCKVFPHTFAQPQYLFWWWIQTIKVINCPPNYTPDEDKISNIRNNSDTKWKLLWYCRIGIKCTLNPFSSVDCSTKGTLPLVLMTCICMSTRFLEENISPQPYPKNTTLLNTNLEHKIIFKNW